MTENEFLLEDRLAKIQSVIEKYGQDKFYISFSGGKDSTVVSALIDLALPKNMIPRVFADTGIELNLIRKFVMERAMEDNRVVMIRPSVPIKDMLEEKGYPFKSKEHSEYLDIYQRNGYTRTTERYLHPAKERKSFGCPEKLKFQFSSDYHLRISDACCFEMKEKPLKKWARENQRPISILGLMQKEGGRRNRTACMAFNKKAFPVSFHPLAVMSKDWEDWFIDTYQVNICPIYLAPYNFTRTGCKGCPFNPQLQHDLDILNEFFPAERKQCELIWKPVYDEYRRIGYRLRSTTPEEEGRQLNLFDLEIKKFDRR